MSFLFVTENKSMNSNLNLGKKNLKWKLILSAVLQPYDNLIFNGAKNIH